MRRHRGMLFALVAALFALLSTGVIAQAATRITTPVTATPGIASEQDSLPETVLAELENYWTSVFPTAFGIEFTALRGGIHPLDSGKTVIPGASSGALCISTPAQIAGNMYYCPSADGIVYDTGVLVPVLLHHYGVPGLIASFAHEFGHAVAARVGVAGGAAINVETQADCFAGNFLAWLHTGSSSLTMSDAELLQAVQPILDFRDQITSKPADPGAHGLGIDRAQAVLLGFRSAPTVCRDISDTSIAPALGRFAVTDESTPRYADVDQVVAAITTAAMLPAQADIDLTDSIGQFGLAVAAVLAVPGATACDAGQWTASVYGTAPRGSLGSWVSDVDEGLDLVRYRPTATFADVTGYIDGFITGCR